MRAIPAIIYTATDLDVARASTERALHAMRLAEQREEKTALAADEKRQSADRAISIAAKARDEADEKRREAATALRAERELFDARPRGPFAQTWASRVDELGLTEWKARSLLELSGYKDKSPDDVSRTSDDSETDTSTSSDSDEEQAADDEEQDTADNALPLATDRSGGRGKPSWLMRALVRDYSMPADLVCDPLAGWGSTLRAALDEGRRAIGAEIDPDIAAAAGELPIRVGPWQQALAGHEVDAIICDPPYSARTHEASRKFGNAREDGSSLVGLGPEYAAWTRDHVFEFVRSWSPRCRGWMVALTDHNLIHDWQDAYEEQGRYAFAPVICLIRGMTVRLCGDGPSSWAIYAMVARPRDMSRWRTLSGGYVGSKSQLEIGDAT